MLVVLLIPKTLEPPTDKTGPKNDPNKKNYFRSPSRHNPRHISDLSCLG